MVLATSNMLQRVFPIRYGSFIGTGFTIDIDRRQYVVTATHVVEGIEDVDEIYIEENGSWRATTVTTLRCLDGSDIVVLCPQRKVTLEHELIPTSSELSMGQDVLIVGYPLGFRSQVVCWDGKPLPFCRKASVATLGYLTAAPSMILLDGLSNVGFSGSPVCFIDSRGNSKVCSVLTDEVRIPTALPGLAEAAGFIVSYNISHATDAIRKNPKGFLLDEF